MYEYIILLALPLLFGFNWKHGEFRKPVCHTLRALSFIVQCWSWFKFLRVLQVFKSPMFPSIYGGSGIKTSLIALL